MATLHRSAVSGEDVGSRGAASPPQDARRASERGSGFGQRCERFAAVIQTGDDI